MKKVNIRVTTIVTHLCEGLDYFSSNVLLFEWMEYGLCCRGKKKSPIFISDLSPVTEQTSVRLEVQGLEVNFGIIFSPDTWRWLMAKQKIPKHRFTTHLPVFAAKSQVQSVVVLWFFLKICFYFPLQFLTPSTLPTAQG